MRRVGSRLALDFPLPKLKGPCTVKLRGPSRNLRGPYRKQRRVSSRKQQSCSNYRAAFAKLQGAASWGPLKIILIVKNRVTLDGRSDSGLQNIQSSSYVSGTHLRSSADQSNPPNAPCEGEGKKLINASRIRRMPHAGCKRRRFHGEGRTAAGGEVVGKG